MSDRATAHHPEVEAALIGAASLLSGHTRGQGSSRRARPLAFISRHSPASGFGQGEGFFFVAADLALPEVSTGLVLASASLSAASFVSRSDFSRAVFASTARA